MAVADILPPEKNKRIGGSSTSANSSRNIRTSSVRSGGSESQTNSSPSRYRQLREELRSQRSGTNPQPLPGPARRYGQRPQGDLQNRPLSESKISNTTAGFMISVGIAIDITQALLDALGIGVVLNEILDIVIGLGFYFWFKIHGVDMMSSKKGLSLFGGWLLETLSVGALPIWTADIILIIYLTRAEERKGVQ